MVVTRAKKIADKCEFVIVTGDISQTASKESYKLFKQCIDQLQLPVFCIPGNHDNAHLLRETFNTSPVDKISSIKISGYLVILLNSQVIDQEYGNLNQATQTQLRNLLQTNKHMPTIIALHHPPIKIHSEWMDNIGLRNAPHWLASLQSFQNIKLVLFGHVHQNIQQELHGIHFKATPSTCYQFKPRESQLIYDTLSPGFRIIDINADNFTSNVIRLSD